MRELSLHILDIAHNSIRARATEIKIEIIANTLENTLLINITDNGSGMDEELLLRVSDPFSTTRNTRIVGMGIPLFKDSAILSGGDLFITSEIGAGTKISANFILDYIDRVPMGDLADTVTGLIMAEPDIRFVMKYSVNNKDYIFDTSDIKKMLEGVPIDDTEVIEYLKEHLRQEISTINGGIII